MTCVSYSILPATFMVLQHCPDNDLSFTEMSSPYLEFPCKSCVGLMFMSQSKNQRFSPAIKWPDSSIIGLALGSQQHFIPIAQEHVGGIFKGKREK